jgi:arylsulfatase
MPVRAPFLLAGGILFVALGLATCARAPEPRARRVILVTCDTLRADHLGCYGYDLPTSPAVDRFAKDATLYENAWSTTSVTAPAIASLMTGLLPDELGVAGGNAYLLPASFETLAETLAKSGVRTSAVVSNWVLRRPAPPNAEAGIPQGFEHYDDTMTHKEELRPVFERGGEDTTDAAIAWLSTAAASKDAPFFLWVHFQDPHGPYTPAPGLAERFARPVDPAEEQLPVADVARVRGAIPAYQKFGDERKPSSYRARYDGEIAGFDAAFGRLMTWLEQHGLLDDALVVFTADHGESLGERDFWFCHEQNLHVEESRIPMIVRFPGGARGERRTDAVGLLDLHPTVLEALGIAPMKLHGSSLFDASGARADRVLPQTLRAFGDAQRSTALVARNLHLVVDPGEPPHLYDLAKDPHEENDLAAKEPAELAAFLERARPFTAPPKGAPSAPRRHGADVDKAFQALGYASGDEAANPPKSADPKEKR